MVFGIYDTLKSGKVNYLVFFSDLVEELPPIRKNLTSAAFKHLDVNRNGFLDLEEIKGKFEPARHPDVLKGLKTIEEAKFEFFNLFTSLHSANKGFKNEKSVSLEDFLEYHSIVNTQIERDADFRSFIMGVWTMDAKENLIPESGKPAIHFCGQ